MTVQCEGGNGRYICINPSHPQGECVVYSRDNGKDWVYAKEARTMTLEKWISRFDNEEAGRLTQEEQLEIKSMLIELRWRRDEMNDFTETMKDKAESWLEAYNEQEG